MLLASALLALPAATPALGQASVTQGHADRSQSPKTIATTETILAPYREKESGMFSSSWVAYILSEGEGEKKDWFIELNGKKLGPFVNRSDLISFSADGRQVVFMAADKTTTNKWDVYVDGQKKWSYEGLAWARYTWPMGIEEGRTIRSQSRAAVCQQSRDGGIVSFFCSRKQGDKTVWANVCNGKDGAYYTDIATGITFFGDRPAYWAWKGSDAKCFVLGQQELGPYKKAYGLKVSPNGRHYAFIADIDNKHMVVGDGKEQLMPGEIETVVVGNEGSQAVAYKKDGAVHVIHNGTEWPSTYSETVWHQFRMTADGKTLAGWFKMDGKWYVVINGKRKFGPYESYYYVEAGETYGLFLGQSGGNVAYWVREVKGGSTGGQFYLNGVKSTNDAELGGIARTVYQDDTGAIVGCGMMGGIDADSAAIADAAALGAANPALAKYVGSHLVYTRKDGDSTFVVADKREIGPYKSAGFFRASPSGRHYAFIAETETGHCVVVDGNCQTPLFGNIYKLTFERESEVAFLSIKNGNVIRLVAKIE